MRLGKHIVFTLFFSVTLTSCGLLGIDDLFDREYGYYIPKHPHFKLKDKRGHVFPHNLDTINIYKLVKRTHTTEVPQVFTDYNNSYDTYLKFFKKGRVLEIVIPSKDPFGNPNKLRETDLIPDFCDKTYYFSRKGDDFFIESFYRGLGYGRYSKSNFQINETGDTLTTIGYVYAKEIIPTEWKKYPVDW